MKSHFHRGAATAFVTASALLAFSPGSSAIAGVGGSATPDANGRIAFATEGQHSQIYTVNPDGSDEQQLTHKTGGVQVDWPDWSPDASRIAYADNTSGSFDLMVMNADGTDQQLLAHTEGWDYTQPRWSPDGSHFVVSRCNITYGYCDLDLMNADGSGRHILVGGHVNNDDPSWSPIGDKIAFNSNRAGLLAAVWVVDTSGGGLTRLTSAAIEACAPSWSPLGTRILFMSDCDRPNQHTFVMNADGSGARRLSPEPPDESMALGSYSPDGRHVVLVGNTLRGSGFDVFTMNANGLKVAPIVTNHPYVAWTDWGTSLFFYRRRNAVNGGNDMFGNITRWGLAGVTALSLGLAAPAWSDPLDATSGETAHPVQPARAFDGRIVFNGQDCQLYTINPDGTALVQVTHLRSRCADAPAWSPDSTRIAVPLFNSDSASIFTMEADGSDLHLVTTDGPGFYDFSVDYTPDGQRIVYERCRPDPPGGCALYSVRLDGTDRQPLTTYRYGIRAGQDNRPQVSPSGRWLTFTRLGWKGIRAQTWLMPMDLSAPAQPITPARFGARSAKWDASGQVVYFWGGSPTGYGEHVFKTPVTGAHVTQLTFSPWPNGDFSEGPSPSGRYVAFISDRRSPDACCNELFAMHSNGSDQHLVTGDLAANVPDWGSAPLQDQPSVPVDGTVSPAQQLIESKISGLNHYRSGSAG